MIWRRFHRSSGSPRHWSRVANTSSVTVEWVAVWRGRVDAGRPAAPRFDAGGADAAARLGRSLRPGSGNWARTCCAPTAPTPSHRRRRSGWRRTGSRGRWRDRPDMPVWPTSRSATWRARSARRSPRWRWPTPTPRCYASSATGFGYPVKLVEHLRIGRGVGISGIRSTRPACRFESPAMSRTYHGTRKRRWRTGRIHSPRCPFRRRTKCSACCASPIASTAGAFTRSDLAALRTLAGPLALALGREQALAQAGIPTPRRRRSTR